MIRVIASSWHIPQAWMTEALDSIGDVFVDWTLDSIGDVFVDWTLDESAQTNHERRGGLRNVWDAIQRAADDDICVIMGGDDKLEPGWQRIIADEYSDPECWLTYGSFRNDDGSPAHSRIQEHDDIRNHPFVWMPITFRAWLAKKVDPTDLQINGWWFQSSGDVALNIPMVEMAGERARFIEEPWYVRRIHEKNDHATGRHMQDFLNWKARLKPKYSALRDRNDTPTRTQHTLSYDLFFKANDDNSYMIGRKKESTPLPADPAPACEPATWKIFPLGDFQAFLSDEPSDALKAKLLEIASSAPDAIIALSSPSEAAEAECKRQGVPFYTSCDGISTVGYVMHKTLAAQFVRWVENDVAPDTKNTIALFAMAHGRVLWHPVAPPWTSTRPIPHVGKTSKSQPGDHWQLITKLKRALPMRAYAIERDVA